MGVVSGMAEVILWTYFLILFLFIFLATRNKKTKKKKIKSACVVIFIFFGPLIIPNVIREAKLARYERMHSKFRIAFNKKCNNAKEEIHRRIENVDGILLLHVRKQFTDNDHLDVKWPYAALPWENSEEEYIREFLKWKGKHNTHLHNYDENDESTQEHINYNYVDVKINNTIVRYRYKNHESRDLLLEPSPPSPARYAVDFHHILDKDSLENLISGTITTIIDTETNEIIAKKTRYAIMGSLNSAGQGSWADAIRCPKETSDRGTVRATNRFVKRVLQPNQGKSE